MPPSSKCTRNQIIDAALEIVSKKGINALTAKVLGASSEFFCHADFYGF